MESNGKAGAMTSTEQQKYNGWTNYETWGVALVLDNDQGTYGYVRERRDEIVREFSSDNEGAVYELAGFLKDYTEELCGLGDDELGIPEPSMMARQLLGGALDDVNFEEIARNILVES